jgi:hypothetical protein
MKMNRILKTSLIILVCAIKPIANGGEVPATRKHQLSDADDVPEGLAKSDWQSIRAAYEAGRHAFRQVEGGWQARNPGQQWTTKFDGRGFIAQPRDAEWEWGLELKGYGFAGQERAIGGEGSEPVVRAEGQRLSYAWDDTVQEWFVNDTRGLEHGFTVKQRPPGAAEALLQFDLGVRGSLVAKVVAGGEGVEFRDASGATALNYAGLKVWDADGKPLLSHFQVIGDTVVRLLVKEKGARYPLTIDPIAQQAFLKSGNNGYSSDFGFGYSVAVSGDTVVVGAYAEKSSTTGVNSLPDEGASYAGAAYVFTRSGSTWSQQAYLKASNTEERDFFGIAVAVSGDTVVVGAYGEGGNATGVNAALTGGSGTQADNSAVSSGAAYVFTRSGSTWSQQAYLKASNTGENDAFGFSVAVSGETVVVGALGENSSGAAYVFTRSGSIWSQQAYLKASNTEEGDLFGTSVAVFGDTVVVGAEREDSKATGVDGDQADNSANGSGAAYVFTRSGGTWNQQAYLKASNTGGNDFFGTSVAVSGDTVVVGALYEDSNATGVDGNQADNTANGSGAAYVFTRSDSTWNQQAYLKASNTGANDNFGCSVAVSGDTVVVGAYGESSSTTGVNSMPNEGGSYAGAAYVFSRSGTLWMESTYLKASNTRSSDYFGNSVAVSGDTVVVGAPYEDSGTTGVNSIPNESSPESGAAYVFKLNGTTWSQQAFLKASNTPFGPGEYDSFGYSVAVAVAGDAVIVGAPNEDSSTNGVNSASDERAIDSGAAYVFVRNGTTWSQQAFLKASNPGSEDGFGTSVAMSGETVVVGSHFEDSSTSGVNSTPDDDAANSGAVYVFIRSGTTWSQQAYLKASNTGVNDNFGVSVGIEGDTVVVGAAYEDSSTMGVSSIPNENAFDSGAAYVFTRTGSTWSQQASLKASNPGSNDNFGFSVAVSGDTVIAGSPNEDSSTKGVNSTPNDNLSDSGSAYVFVRRGTRWIQQAYLKARNSGSNDYFGHSVGVSGKTVAVGAFGEDSSTTGVNSEPDELAQDAGAAYVFARIGEAWSDQAFLKPSNTGSDDRFGKSVAVSGKKIVVGAHFEDSGRTGVDSTPNESAYNSGAAYVFGRSGTTWSEEAYLKASNSGANDNYGFSVAISDTRVVVGAKGEDSSTTGVNSAPNDRALESGAAYLFSLPTPETSSTQADIVVMGNGEEIDDDDLTPVVTDHTHFGAAMLNDMEVTRSFVIGNQGAEVLNLMNIPAVEISGLASQDFKVTRAPQTPIQSNGSTSFDVTFNPQFPGLRTATVSITSNDPVIDPFTFDISGYGSWSAPIIQTIFFAAPSSVFLGQGQVALNAHTTSGLPVTLSVTSGPATLTGNILNLTGVGTVKVQATQAGGDNYQGALPVTRSLTVKTDPTVLTLVNLSQRYDGLPKPVATVGTTDSVTLSYRVGGVFGSNAPSNAGSHAVRAVAGGVTRTGTLVITKAPLYVIPDNKRKFAGQPNPTLTLDANGYQGIDTAAGVLTAPFLLTTTAKVNSPGGFYAIKSSGGAASNYFFIHRSGVMMVESFAGPYEALLLDGFNLPVGKLNVTVASSSKSFTGKLCTASEAASLSLSGLVTTDLDNEQCNGTASVQRNGARYDVSFWVPLNGDMSASITRDDAFESSASNGCKLLVLPRNAKVAYAGASTVVLEPGLPADEAVPVGAGWAQATTSTKGLLTLKGKLGDGTAFTAASSPDGQADPGYRLFVQPYKAARSGAYLAGAFRMEVSSSAVGAREMRGVAGAPLTWMKEGLPADSSYRTSFGPVTTTMTLDPWLKPAESNTLAVLLGLTGGTFRVEHSDTESLSDPNLPSSVALSAKNVVSVLLPQTAPPNITKWKTTINASLGTFTGSFELLDITEKRTVPFSGVLRQPVSGADTLIGDGHFMLPALKTAPGNEKVSGEVMFSR